MKMNDTIFHVKDLNLYISYIYTNTLLLICED